MPFTEAAEMGTRKVITDHSTIGIVVTTDGSITEIPREDYVDAEERVIHELQEINKPFLVLLNTTKPYAAETDKLRGELEEKYSVPVTAVNCAQLKVEDIYAIMEKLLYEFPVKEIKVNFPRWIETLSPDHWLKQEMINAVKSALFDVHKLRELDSAVGMVQNSEHAKKAFVDKIALGEGSASVEVTMEDALFYQVLSEATGMEIEGDYQLISTIKVLSEAKREYDKVKYALEEVKQKGYGIVTPVLDEMKLDEPVIVKHGNKFGVKLKASAPSIHLIRADIETEISPIVGTEKQSEDLINYLNTEMSEDPNKIWDLNMFGRSMSEMVKEGLQSKLYRMPEDAQMKLQETLQKIINEGSGGLICIIL
jgi:stage IV sporulation protein A